MKMHAAHFVAMSALALTACDMSPRVDASMDGLELRVPNVSYNEVWDASHAALASQFPRVNGAKDKGALTAGSNGCAYGPSDYVGIYIHPVNGGETKFTFVKIVALDEGSRKGAETAQTLKESIEHNLSKSIH